MTPHKPNQNLQIPNSTNSQGYKPKQNWIFREEKSFVVKELDVEPGDKLCIPQTAIGFF